jgi:hypothetical protein
MRHRLALIQPALASAWKKLSRNVVLGLLFFLPAERKIAVQRWLRGREQYRTLKKADCAVVSFGKSGRTWLRVMLSRFYQVKHGGHAVALLSGQAWAAREFPPQLQQPASGGPGHPQDLLHP